MTIIASRTQLLPRQRAENFAKCLAANPRFTAVEVKESRRSKKAERFFVSYLPASEARVQDRLELQQAVQTLRAETQADNYLFVLDEGGRFFHCLNLESGEVYETTERTCSCPQQHYRTGPVGLKCKHIQILRSGNANVQTWQG